MTSVETTGDVIVVGGGLAGLAAAAYASRAGLSVQVLERAASLGGRAATDRDAGFALNRGAHALYCLGEGVEVLRDPGIRVPGNVVEAGGKALLGGALHQLPVGPLSLVTTSLLGWSAKATAASVLDRIPKMTPSEFASSSVTEWLETTIRRADVRAVIEAFIRVSTYANAPETFSAETALRQLQRAYKGSVTYVDGGWQTLIDGLAARATAWGARIVTGVRVTGLEAGDDGHAVHLADGRTLRARAIVLAVPPRDAAALLASAGGTVPASIRSAVPVHAAALDLSLSSLPLPEPRFVLGIDQPLYLSVHSAVATLAPPGGAVVHLLKYLPGESNADSDRAELEALMDLAQPGWRKVLVRAQYLPRMTASERLDLASEGGERGRPGPEDSGLPGVYFAGDWVQGGSALADASLGSAREAASRLVARVKPSRAVA